MHKTDENHHLDGEGLNTITLGQMLQCFQPRAASSASQSIEKVSMYPCLTGMRKPVTTPVSQIHFPALDFRRQKEPWLGEEEEELALAQTCRPCHGFLGRAAKG